MVILGSKVLTAVVMKSCVFWDITPHSPVTVNLRFEGNVSIFKVEE
jgi:hypothetical protein